MRCEEDRNQHMALRKLPKAYGKETQKEEETDKKRIGNRPPSFEHQLELGVLSTDHREIWER